MTHRGQVLEYIEVTPGDIRTANRLAHDVLGRTLDELAPQTRRFLGRLEEWVTQECARLQMTRADFRFMRREMWTLMGWSETQLRTHLETLVRLEYLIVHRGGRGQSFVYELLYSGEGKDGQSFMMGLLDPDELEMGRGYDGKFAGSSDEFAGGSRPHRGVIAPGSREVTTSLKQASGEASGPNLAENAEITVPETPPGIVPPPASYPPERTPNGNGRRHR